MVNGTRCVGALFGAGLMVGAFCAAIFSGVSLVSGPAPRGSRRPPGIFEESAHPAWTKRW